jgi:Uncharacterized protein involved in exopolysaccharide biosynthesis
MTDNNKNKVRLRENNEGISLKELILQSISLFAYLFRNWVIILSFAIVGGGLMVVYSFVKQIQYKGTVSFIVDESVGQPGGTLGAAAGIASQFGINLGGLGQSGGFFEGDNIVKFLLSRSMIEKTLLSDAQLDGQSVLLVDRYVEFTGLRQRWAKKNERLHNFKFQDTTSMYLQDSLIGSFYKTILKNYLVVKKPDRKLNIIEVTFECPDEWFSKTFVTTLIDNASDFYIQTRTQRAQENLDVLTRQVDSVYRELHAAIRGVASANDANPNPNRAFQSLRVPSQLRTVDVQANTEILKELVANQEMAKISLRNAKPIIQILDHPIIPLENNRLGWKLAFVLGCLLGGFLISLVLLGKKFYRHIMEADPS